MTQRLPATFDYSEGRLVFPNGSTPPSAGSSSVLVGEVYFDSSALTLHFGRAVNALDTVLVCEPAIGVEGRVPFWDSNSGRLTSSSDVSFSPVTIPGFRLGTTLQLKKQLSEPTDLTDYGTLWLSNADSKLHLKVDDVDIVVGTGSGSVGKYVHDQTGSALTEWSVNHQLGTQDLDVTVRDGTDPVDYDHWAAVDDDNITIYFISAQSGKALILG